MVGEADPEEGGGTMTEAQRNHKASKQPLRRQRVIGERLGADYDTVMGKIGRLRTLEAHVSLLDSYDTEPLINKTAKWVIDLAEPIYGTRNVSPSEAQLKSLLRKSPMLEGHREGVKQIAAAAVVVFAHSILDDFINRVIVLSLEANVELW
jgi:O-acetyl-ADP-ribose deacetylase (regulator of RNase III)